MAAPGGLLSSEGLPNGAVNTPTNEAVDSSQRTQAEPYKSLWQGGQEYYYHCRRISSDMCKPIMFKAEF